MAGDPDGLLATLFLEGAPLGAHKPLDSRGIFPLDTKPEKGGPTKLPQ